MIDTNANFFYPILSIIVTSRNDNHGGNLNKRNQIFIDHLCYQTKKFQVPIELIIVEWNPPEDRPPLKDAFTYNYLNEFIDIKYVTVPRVIHYNNYSGKDILPLYQMIAKNVGARYAKANYLLFTNIDIIFPDEFYLWLKSNQLSENFIYRCVRIDISDNIYNIDKPNLFLDFAKNNQIFASAKEYNYDLINNKIISHIIHDPIVTGIDKQLFTNACGDFQLLNKKHFLYLRGYPEFDSYSIHIDSLFEYQCYFLGLEEFELEFPIFHIQHGAGWQLNDDNNKNTTKKFLLNDIHSFSIYDIYAYTNIMKSTQNFIFNDNDWGLNNYTLPIFSIIKNEFIQIQKNNNLNNSFTPLPTIIEEEFKNTKTYYNINLESKIILLFSNNFEDFYKIRISFKNAKIIWTTKNTVAPKNFQDYLIFTNTTIINEILESFLEYYSNLIDIIDIIVYNFDDIILPYNSSILASYFYNKTNYHFLILNLKIYNYVNKDIDYYINKYINEFSNKYSYFDFYITILDNRIIFSKNKLLTLLNDPQNHYIHYQDAILVKKKSTKIDISNNKKYTNNPFENIQIYLKNQNDPIYQLINTAIDSFYYYHHLGFTALSNLIKHLIEIRKPFPKYLSYTYALMLYNAQNIEEAIKFTNIELEFYPNDPEVLEFKNFLLCLKNETYNFYNT